MQTLKLHMSDVKVGQHKPNWVYFLWVEMTPYHWLYNHLRGFWEHQPVCFTAWRLHHKLHVSVRSSLAFISVLQAGGGGVWVYRTLVMASVLGPMALAQHLSEAGRVKVQSPPGSTIYPLPSFPSGQLDSQRKWLSESQFSQHLAEAIFKKINGPQPRLLLPFPYVVLHAIYLTSLHLVELILRYKLFFPITFWNYFSTALLTLPVLLRCLMPRGDLYSWLICLLSLHSVQGGEPGA